MTRHHLSTAVNQPPAIAGRAAEDLGIDVGYIAVTTDDVARRIITQPNSFDLVGSDYFSPPNLIPSGNLMGVDASRIGRADQVASVIREGTVAGQPVGSDGTAPFEVLHLQDQLSPKFAGEPSQWITPIPTTCNADTLGIRPDLIDEEISSWASLLGPAFAGRAAILDIPRIGIMDAAMRPPTARGGLPRLGRGLPRTPEGRHEDAAYAFVDWFPSGWAGAHLSRQGHSPAVLETAREEMEPYEWACRHEGRPAEQPITAPGGDALEEADAVSDGGTYEERIVPPPVRGTLVCS